jgi:hypothetical protein
MPQCTKPITIGQEKNKNKQEDSIVIRKIKKIQLSQKERTALPTGTHRSYTCAVKVFKSNNKKENLRTWYKNVPKLIL